MSSESKSRQIKRLREMKKNPVIFAGPIKELEERLNIKEEPRARHKCKCHE